jgi:hypothetical protein
MNLTLMLVLACSMSAMAQSGMSSDSSMKKDHMAGKKMSMTGCVSEKDGKCMLMTKKHPDGIQLISSEDLKPHVGHEIMVNGTMQHMDAGSSGDMAPSGSMSKDQTDQGMKQMNVAA